MKRHGFPPGGFLILSMALLVLALMSRQAAATLEDPVLNGFGRMRLNELMGYPRPLRFPLTDKEMAQFHSLKCSGQFSKPGDLYNITTPYITSLGGIEGFVSLQSLGLIDQRIVDLTPLNGLVRLQWLDLSGGTTEALGVMDAMEALTLFDISGGSLRDVSAFKAPAALWQLNLSGNELIDIAALPAALAACESLSRLDLRGNPLSAEAWDVVLPALLAENPGLELLADPAAARGDADLDGIVNAADFAALKQSYGLGHLWSQGDFNGDGRVDIADFVILKRNYAIETAAAARLVPEPSTLVLVLGGAMAFVSRRRRRPTRGSFERTLSFAGKAGAV